MVETPRDGFGDGEEGGGGGPGCPETMLGLGQGQAGLEVGEDESLEDFDGGREEGNWPIGRALAVGFAGFGNGDDDGLSPDGGDVGLGQGQVEEEAEVLEGCGS